MPPESGEVELLVAGFQFRLSVPQRYAEAVRVYYGSLVVPASSPKAESVRLEWYGLSLHDQGGRRVALATCDSQIPALTFLAVQNLLIKNRPDIIAIHGTAVVDLVRSRIFLFIGDSGSGKTTQALSLIAADCRRFRLLAEDLLLIDPEYRHLWPYPRAASVRERGTERLHPVEAIENRPFPLNSIGEVVLLFGDMEGDEGGFILAASAISAGLEEELGRRPGVRISNSVDGFRVVRFDNPPEPHEAAGIEDALRAEGALILWAGLTRRWSRQFAASPVLRALNLPAALAALSHSIIRPARSTGTSEASRLFQLASLLSQARFWSLVPGGGGELTAAHLIERFGAEELS